MNWTMPELVTCYQQQFVVGRSETIVGHCVNVRNLGKLAFFTLRSQTWSLQVVCTAKSVIDELRFIDEFSLVEVTGIFQEKHRRREHDKVEHELNAKTLTRVGLDAMRSVGLANGPSGAQELFQCIEPVVQAARLTEAARTVLRERGITELPPPDSLQFLDQQALAVLAHEHGSTSEDQRYCSHPPFHAYSRFLAAGGLYRFAFFSSAMPGRRLLHIVVCQPGSGEMRAIFGELARVIFGDGMDSPRSKDGEPLTGTRSPVRIHSVGPIEERPENHPQPMDQPHTVDAELDVDSASTFRDRQLSSGFGISERQVFYRNGAALAHCCVLAQDFAGTEEMAVMLGGTRQAVAAWLRIFNAGVIQPIPRMGMLTLVVNDRIGAAGATAGKQGGARSKVPAFDPYVDLLDGDGLSRARVAHVAQLAEVEQLRVEVEILRGHAPGLGEMARPMAIDSALRAIESVLPAYKLPLDLVHRLLDLCRRTHPEWRIERPVDLFQMLWTLLGSASVKSLLESSSSTIDGVRQLIEHRIISDKRQLLYVYPAVLPAIDTLLSGCVGEEHAALVIKLRTLMAQRPTLFATAAQTLATSRRTRDEHSRRIFENLLRCVELGVATPLLVRLTSSLIDDPRQLRLLLRALRKTGETVFPNEVLQLAEVAAVFVDACPRDMAVSLRVAGLSASHELSREILYYLYRPVTMDYAMFCDILNHLTDRTQDWGAWGIVGHGEFWNATLGCYEYWLDRGFGRIGKVRLYGSKNIGSFFGKSTAGICTDINIELFNRPDHYHLNIIDADDGRVAGNVQLYIGEGANGRFLLVRGINPIQGFCVNRGVDELVRCILHAICDMAAFGGFSEVRLCEQNGLWNSDSSRAEVRACLKRMCAEMPLRLMDQVFHLYDYYGRALNVSGYYRIWELSSGLPTFPISAYRTTG